MRKNTQNKNKNVFFSIVNNLKMVSYNVKADRINGSFF